MPNGTYSTESRYFLVFGIKPNCLTNVSKAIRYTDLLQLKIGPKSLHMLSLEAEGTYLTLFENCRIVDPPTGIRSRADPYESNDFRWTVKARQKIEVNKIRKGVRFRCTDKDSCCFWSILFRRKSEGTVPSCSCTWSFIFWLRFFI